MTYGNKIILINGFGRGGRTLPIITAHLNFCESSKKAGYVSVPKKENVLSNIIRQDFFQKLPDIRTLFDKDFNSLVKSYKSVQRKYYPEKDVFVGSRK